MPSSGQTPNCVKLLRWKFFYFFVFQHMFHDHFHCLATHVSVKTLNRG